MPPSATSASRCEERRAAAAVGCALTDPQVGFSSAGEVSTLRYPSPASPDQVDFLEYINSSLPNMGAFVGVRLAGGPLRWLRDARVFSCKQAYLSDDDNIVQTTFVALDGSVVVTQTDVVSVDRDVHLQRVDVETAAGTSVEVVRYTNLAPCTFLVDYLPVADWVGCRAAAIPLQSRRRPREGTRRLQRLRGPCRRGPCSASPHALSGLVRRVLVPPSTSDPHRRRTSRCLSLLSKPRTSTARRSRHARWTGEVQLTFVTL
jgi:hypothetical protein